MNWFIVEQLPLIAPERYADPLGTTTVGDFVREQVLRLSYTAHDLAGFARDLGYDGEPFVWNPEDRRHRIARLDALYFNLYGLDRDEAAYVLDTFPIVRDADERRSEEHTSELQSLMRISYAVFCLKKNTPNPPTTNQAHTTYAENNT